LHTATLVVPEHERPLVVVDVDPAWERIVVGSHRLTCHPPRAGLPLRADVRVLVNLAAPGALELVAAWPAGASAPLACVTAPGSEHAVLLRAVTVVSGLRPADPIATRVRRRRRGDARVVAAGSNARALLALRRVLAGDGIGVSLAWDAAQARDLCDLVHPHVLVIDLGLPHGGYDLVVALGLGRRVPDLVVVAAGADARAFAAAFERARRRARLPLRRDALGELFGCASGTGLRPQLAPG
jgi:hypothetical protein